MPMTTTRTHDYEPRPDRRFRGEPSSSSSPAAPTRAVPVPGHRLGVKGALHIEHLAHAVHEVAGHPHLVTHGDAGAGAHLVLPLGRQHLTVQPGDGHAGIQAEPAGQAGSTACDGVRQYIMLTQAGR